MIGNDIVDLDLAKKSHRWQEQRFLQKIFNQKEQKLISEATDPFCCIWRLWTMKESAFKAIIRSAPAIHFSPSNFICELLSSATGYVTIGNHHYHITSITAPDFIYSFSVTESSESIKNIYFKIDMFGYYHQHSSVVERLTREVSDLFGINRKHLHLKKNDFGIPEIHNKNQRLPLSISISHHGYYCAYALALKPTSYTCKVFS